MPQPRRRRSPSRKLKIYYHQQLFPFSNYHKKAYRICEFFHQNKLGKQFIIEGKATIALPRYHKYERYNEWLKRISPIVKRFGIRKYTDSLYPIDSKGYKQYRAHVTTFVDKNEREVFKIYTKVEVDSYDQNESFEIIDDTAESKIIFTYNPLAERVAKAIAETDFTIEKRIKKNR